MSVKHWLGIVLAVGSVIGCAGQQTQRVSFDERFGDTVRDMVEAQTYRSDDEVPTLRGDKATEAMREYRREKSRRHSRGLEMLRLPGSRSGGGGRP